jgi:hypothetical protein
MPCKVFVLRMLVTRLHNAYKQFTATVPCHNITLLPYSLEGMVLKCHLVGKQKFVFWGLTWFHCEKSLKNTKSCRTCLDNIELRKSSKCYVLRKFASIFTYFPWLVIALPSLGDKLVYTDGHRCACE